MNLKLNIISPEQTFFSGDVLSVTLPGTMAPFTILSGHAPIVSSLTTGNLTYVTSEGERKLMIEGGFVEMSHGVVDVCIESGKVD